MGCVGGRVLWDGVWMGWVGARVFGLLGPQDHQSLV